MSTVRPLPRPAAVLREQIRTVGAVLAPMLLLGGIAIFVAVSIGVIVDPGSGGVRFDSESFFPLVLLAYVLPLVVWWGQPFRSPTYHLSTPAPRPLNHLSRGAGGILCLYAVVLSALLGALVIAAATGGAMGVYRLNYGEEHTVPAWFWCAPFVAATVAYAFATALMLGTKHPIIWGIVSLWAPAILMEAAENLGSPGHRPLGWLDSWAHGPLGFVPVLTGMSKGGAVPGVHPDFSTWLASSATWSVLAAIGLTLALRRHRDC